MDHLAFFPYHNRHITFFYNGVEKGGVVVDTIPYDEKEFSTQYVFISSDKMREWKEAEQKKDTEKMKSLEEKIDILRITNPSIVNH